jgi:hypothetical protein
MSQLLIHSMNEFSSIILPVLEKAGVRDVVEIGAEHGGLSKTLAAYVQAHQGGLTTIDPAPSAQFKQWAAGNGMVNHIETTSLEALREPLKAQAWFIDGDHNWYSVYHELHAIRAQCLRQSTPLLAFVHDVSWPSARRDSYYNPATVPEEFRQPHSYEGGAIPGYPGLLAHRGFRGAGAFAFALQEGGPYNGVLTAVEDFVSDCAGEQQALAWAFIPGVFGLGILFDPLAPWAASLSDLLAPLHEHPLLQTLETNRLANYLKVLDWQDQASASTLHAAI